MILRQIFNAKRDENGDCKRFHNEKHPSFYRSPNIVRAIKSMIIIIIIIIIIIKLLSLLLVLFD